MEQDKYNLLLSILRDYYGQQQMRGDFGNTEQVAGELASIISTLFAPVPDGQRMYPIEDQMQPYYNDTYIPPHVNQGHGMWYPPEIREPVAEAAEVCMHRLHDIAERACHDISMLKEFLAKERAAEPSPKISPTQSVGDFPSEYGDDSDVLKRKRNREAQKRFRDRQKRKKDNIETEYSLLWDIADELEEANIALEQRIYLEIKNIAVSEVILLAFGGLYPEQNSILNCIMSDKNEKVKEAENALVLSPTMQGPQSPGKLEKPANSEISEAMKRIYNKAYRMKEPESFYLYYREWQIEANRLHNRSLENKDGKSEDLMISKMNELYQVWTVNLKLYPDNFARVFAENYAPADQAEILWTFISGKLIKNVTEDQIRQLHKEYKQYLSDCEGCDKDIKNAWRKLSDVEKEFKAAPKSAREASAVHVKVVAQAQICSSLVKKLWTLSVEFARRFLESIGHRNAFLCNIFASPHTVDWVAITKMLLDKAQENGILLD